VLGSNTELNHRQLEELDALVIGLDAPDWDAVAAGGKTVVVETISDCEPDDVHRDPRLADRAADAAAALLAKAPARRCPAAAAAPVPPVCERRPPHAATTVAFAGLCAVLPAEPTSLRGGVPVLDLDAGDHRGVRHRQHGDRDHQALRRSSPAGFAPLRRSLRESLRGFSNRRAARVREAMIAPLSRVNDRR
jgi:hypothetical protein